MGVAIRTSGRLPASIWDEQAMRQVGLTAAALIQARTFDQGRGLDDQFHDSYRPGYFRFRKRKGYQVTPPNLTRTGRMRRSFRVLYVSPVIARLGLSGAAAVYGHFVNKRRPWLGSSERDRAILRKAMPGIVRDAIARGRGAT
jgi:hypothetical protein